MARRKLGETEALLQPLAAEALMQALRSSPQLSRRLHDQMGGAAAATVRPPPLQTDTDTDLLSLTPQTMQALQPLQMPPSPPASPPPPSPPPSPPAAPPPADWISSRGGATDLVVLDLSSHAAPPPPPPPPADGL